MMDNIQAIIANNQYKGALENQNATIKPFHSFPTPTQEEFEQFLRSADLSLEAILDSPIGVFEFKRYAEQYPNVPVIIDFLVQFEKVSHIKTPDLDSARSLMEIALQLPTVYQPHVTQLKSAFKSVFGPMEFFVISKNNPTEGRIVSLELDDNFPIDGPFEGGERSVHSSHGDIFPDRTRPKSSMKFLSNFGKGKSAAKKEVVSSFISPFGPSSFAFGGYMHTKKEVEGGPPRSEVDTEILHPSPKKLRERENTEGLLDISFQQTLEKSDTTNPRGDFYDRQQAEKMKQDHMKIQMKKNSVSVFSDLAAILRSKAEELLESFKHNTKEYLELINMLWYSEEKMDVNAFILFRDLGRGAFGVVSSAKTKTTGTLTAIKCMNKKLIKGKKAKRLVLAEKAILEVLGDNPSNFTIWLKYSFQDKDYFYMALPLCTGGDLGYHLRRRHCLDETRSRFHLAEILEGIDHLHSLNIIYRDLKPDNIIFDAEGHCRISDMGLAIQTQGHKIKGKAGTPGYWAPEVITRQPYSFSADYWSLGCLLYEMLTGLCPFSSTNSGMDRNKATLQWRVKFPRRVGRPDKPQELLPFPDKAKTVILGLLHRDRTKRYDANDVRKDPFFIDIDWYKLRRRELPAPWRVKKGRIYAADQVDLDYQNNDRNYKNIKLLPEDEIRNFNYTSKYSHQLDIVKVLETREMGKLRYDIGYEPGCCSHM